MSIGGFESHFEQRQGFVVPSRDSDQSSARRVPVDWPREAEEKSDKNGPLFERSEFGPFRFFLNIAG